MPNGTITTFTNLLGTFIPNNIKSLINVPVQENKRFASGKLVSAMESLKKGKMTKKQLREIQNMFIKESYSGPMRKLR